MVAFSFWYNVNVRLRFNGHNNGRCLDPYSTCIYVHVAVWLENALYGWVTMCKVSSTITPAVLGVVASSGCNKVGRVFVAPFALSRPTSILALYWGCWLCWYLYRMWGYRFGYWTPHWQWINVWTWRIVGVIWS